MMVSCTVKFAVYSVQCTVERLTCSRLVTLSGPARAEDMLASQSLSSLAPNNISHL